LDPSAGLLAIGDGNPGSKPVGIVREVVAWFVTPGAAVLVPVLAVPLERLEALASNSQTGSTAWTALFKSGQTSFLER
jgi:hypothetical protein